MSREVLNLDQAAEHVHIDANELRHFAQRGEIEATEHGGTWWFEHRALDEWAQRNLLAANHREQLRQHRVMLDENRRAHHEHWRVADLFHPDGLDLALHGHTKAGIVRDMSDLAAKTGLVYDVDGLYGELIAREEIASTAVGEGAAFLHPRFHDPYLFEKTFVVYARSERPIFFGAPDGAATRHFFLVCANDHELHMHILGRLAVMTHATEFLSLLEEAADAAQAMSVIRNAEDQLLR